MSLINDALKRVKTAQQQQPPSASVGPQLKPVEPTPPARSFVGVLTPVAFVLVALLGLFLLWELRKKSDLADGTPVRAQTDHAESGQAPTENASLTRKPDSSADRSSAASPDTVTRTPVIATSSGPSNPGAPAGATRSSATELSQSPGAAQSLQSTSQVAAVAIGEGVLGTNQTGIPNAVSNNVGTNDVAPPKPAPLKLQGIVYDPKRPSAVINGRTVFVGDRIKQMRVVAITAETATLVDSSHTNVLSLAE